MVKVGIIGLGTMGRQHMDAYRQMPDVEVAAVYTTTVPTVQRRSRRNTASMLQAT
jgi:glyceraldehyde-3-phosphate dehydrogenase/erythrose-4-phosphate dehydrogenase